MSRQKVPENPLVRVIDRSIDLIKSFNPTTHSIDSHLADNLAASGNKHGSKVADAFVQQVVYGTFKEKACLNAFINLFYAENAASVSRADITLYTVLAYLIIYRMQEMGFGKFKEVTQSQDPSKVNSIMSYVYNEETLYSSIRSAWMQVIDLAYVESTMIGSIERFMPEAHKYLSELTQAGNAQAEAEAAKAAAEAEGTAGMTKVSKALTRPRSPKLSRPRAPVMPEPEEIMNTLEVHEVPSYLNRTTIASLAETKKIRQRKVREDTLKKYKEKDLPKFNETKYGKPKLEIAQELEEARVRELKFNDSYYVPPPNHDNTKAKVRLNVASILREDYLFRKQQASDVAVLEEYEENLRDPTEFYIWQKQMETHDEMAKLRQVVERREQAKQSSEEAAAAFKMMQDNNKEIAGMIRKQADTIVKRKELATEILMLKRQETVAAVSEVRDSAPGLAVLKVRERLVEEGKESREKLKKNWEAKMKENEAEELIKADRIRQLKAENSIHKKFIKEFDPTQVAGPLFLDQMSYLEMKERVDQTQEKSKKKIVDKREDIFETKQKRARELEERALSIAKLRQIKSQSNSSARDAKLKLISDKEERAKRIREDAALELRDELKVSRQRAAAERKALQDEQDRVRRQQQYLGAGAGAVEEENNKQMQMAAERKVKNSQRAVADHLQKMGAIKVNDRRDKERVAKRERQERMLREEEVTKEVLADKRRSVNKLKESILMKKAMVQEGREQAARTRAVKVETNRYAQRINDEIHETTLRNKDRLGQ
jgi:hypothetical protein